MARKITFVPRSNVADEAIARNKDHCRRLGLPMVGETGPVPFRLAVVGGGPSVVNDIQELKAWDGEIWAVNGAFLWCLENGIDATFYTIDAKPTLVEMAAKANRAVLGSMCDPCVFEAVNGPVEVFDIDENPCGTTTVCTAPMVAAARGHGHVTLFGCESSFTDKVHSYSWADQNKSRVLVECGGAEYLTTPQLVMQAEYLAELAREIPSFIDVRGRGFLPALIDHGDYSVSKVSPDIMESVRGN